MKVDIIHIKDEYRFDVHVHSQRPSGLAVDYVIGEFPYEMNSLEDQKKQRVLANILAAGARAMGEIMRREGRQADLDEADFRNRRYAERLKQGA
jgi:hypothetical protein